MTDHPPRAQFDADRARVTSFTEDRREYPTTEGMDDPKPMPEHFGCKCPNCGCHLHGTLVVRK